MGVTAQIQHLIQWLKSDPSWGLPERLQLRADFYGFLAALVTGLTDTDSDGSAYLAHRIAERIEQAMKERFDRADDGTLGESGIQRIADEMGISASHCYKVFKRIYQMSPRQYISFRILDEAKSLLNNLHLSIEEVSFRLKYHDAAHFSRQFKRWTGYYPTEYRKQIRKVDVCTSFFNQNRRGKQRTKNSTNCGNDWRQFVILFCRFPLYTILRKRVHGDED